MASTLAFQLLFALFCVSFAADYQVSVGESGFTPNTLTTPLNVGDTITFTFSSSDTSNNLYIFEGTSANCLPTTPLLGCAPSPSDGVCTLAALGINPAVDPYTFTITSDLAGKNLVFSTLSNCDTTFGTAVVATTTTSSVCGLTLACTDSALPFCLNPDTAEAVCVAGCTTDADCIPYVDSTPLCMIGAGAITGMCTTMEPPSNANSTCTTTSGCTEDPSLPFCLNPGTPSAVCVAGCTSDGDCVPYAGTTCSADVNATAGQCIQGNGTTSGCTTTSGCDDPTLPFCLNPGTPEAECVAGCTTDADCLPYERSPVCYFDISTLTGECVTSNSTTITCTTTSGCTDNPIIPFCVNPGTDAALCVSGCSSDADCAPYEGTPTCSISEGATTGECTAICTTTSGCTDLLPFCLNPGTNTATCIAGCTSDADCVPYEGTPVCTLGECVATDNSTTGCTTTSGCDDSTLPFCLNPDTDDSVCTPGCTSDSDCVPYEGTPVCFFDTTSFTAGRCVESNDTAPACTTTSGCSGDLPFCRNPGEDDAECISGCEDDDDCDPYTGTPFCATDGDRSGLCVGPKNCSSVQYPSPDEDNTCDECPQFPDSFNCATRKCTGPDDVVCDTCLPDYTMNTDGTCSPPTSGQSCDLCPLSGETLTACPESEPICCGCGEVGLCASECFAKCEELINCTTPECPNPNNCQNKGACDLIPAGTCLQCNPGYILVPDNQTSLGIACEPEVYQSCDVCSSEESQGCPADTTCCCGTCRKVCNIMCAEHDCDADDLPDLEDILLLLIHMISNTTCEDSDLNIYITYIEASIRYQLGSWSGSYNFNHQCRKSSKRQADGDTIETEVYLLGTNAEAQGHQLTDNIPQTATANGVTVILISAEPRDSGLSGGEIAGIVIGSVAAAALIVIVLALILFRRGSPRSV